MKNITTEIYNAIAEVMFNNQDATKEDLDYAIDWFQRHFWATKYDEIEAVLGECFDPDLLPKMEEEWGAFYKNPKHFSGTVVIKMVNQWIDEQPINFNRKED